MTHQGDTKQEQKSRKRKLQWFERQKSSSKLKAELLKKQAAERKKQAEQAQGNAQPNEISKAKEALAKLKQLKEKKAAKESRGKKKKVYADVRISFCSLLFLYNMPFIESICLFFAFWSILFNCTFSPLNCFKIQKDLQLKLIESVNEKMDIKKAHVAEVEVCAYFIMRNDNGICVSFVFSMLDI